MSDVIRVLIVDDSSLVRQSIGTILSSDPDVEVVGEARNGREACEKTLTLRPHVITMDLTMPEMDGAEAIMKIMEECPTPIIVVSSMNVNVIAKALALGAMDFVAVTGDIGEIRHDLIEKVKIASRVRAIRHLRSRFSPKTVPVPREAASKIVVVGVSTGGPQALQILFSKLPPDFPAAILVVQHISPGFIQGLGDWLAQTTPLQYQVAKSGDMPQKGTVYFAPDNVHMMVDKHERIVLKEDLTKKMVHVPGIDVLMESVAEVFRGNAVGVIMTGMGRDGVAGISAINKSGGRTLAQDEKTSVIFGMNKLAIEAGAIDHVLPLEAIAEELVRIVKDNNR
ncbi:MAG: chemotaxis-specific protein-glutamate methyltransferase CheB [Candidatus Omnitrophota bacterium]